LDVVGTFGTSKIKILSTLIQNNQEK